MTERRSLLKCNAAASVVRHRALERVCEDSHRMYGGATRQIGDLMSAGGPVGDHEVLRARLAQGGQQVGLRHGSRDVLGLRLIAEGARHAAAGRLDGLHRKARDEAERGERSLEGAEALLVAMSMDMGCRGYRPKIEGDILAREPIADQMSAIREPFGLIAWQKRDELVAESEQA